MNMNKEKYLGISLNCGLKVILNRKGKFNLDEEYPEPHNEICEVVEVLKSNSSFDYEISDGNVSYGFIELDEFDFICRPLTDITKPIEHKGEKFVPLERILGLGKKDGDASSPWNYKILINDNNLIRIELVRSQQTLELNFRDLSLKHAMLLIDWHFAIGLDKTDYIDVNTLEVNPYK